MSTRTKAGVYALAIFLSSGLLFLIEPIAGKRVLPLLGGSAAVWTACLVFFQTALLLGYLMAHWLITRARPRAQGTIYLALLALAIVQLFVGLKAPLRADAMHPVASVLWLLTAMIGLPFVVLSVSSPMLQAWFARDGDPAFAYRLYAVSNVGSLLALVSYPWLLEPRATLSGQTMLLATGLVALAVVCVIILRNAKTADVPLRTARAPRAPVAGADVALWISLAACGSLLLSAITTHLTRNVAAIPLLWVLPLIAYLLSFVVAFSDQPWQTRGHAIALGLTGFAMAGYRLHRGDLTVPVAAAVAIYCGALFGICLFCHGELYRRRPSADRLTTFYFCLALGGAVGATLAGVVAPMTLTGEYELVIGLGTTMLIGGFAVADLGWPAHLVAVGGAVAFAFVLREDVRVDRANAIMRERNFYGTLQVEQVHDPRYRAFVNRLLNGIIEHGEQVFRVDLDTVPTTYYGRSSGVGLAVSLCCPEGPKRIGVIGLGTGTMAAYGRPGDVIRFYDINRAVQPIARKYFSYLSRSKAQVSVVTGDARLSLEAEPPQQYDVLVVDAFSGDAIPVHLITAEALALYRRHLSARGAVAFHVSNRYLDLAPVVKQLADREHMSAVDIASGDDVKHAVFSADWVIVTANRALADALELSKDRSKITIPPGLRLWTDDYNSLLPILKRKSRKD